MFLIHQKICKLKKNAEISEKFVEIFEWILNIFGKIIQNWESKMVKKNFNSFKNMQSYKKNAEILEKFVEIFEWILNISGKIIQNWEWKMVKKIF